MPRITQALATILAVYAQKHGGASQLAAERLVFLLPRPEALIVIRFFSSLPPHFPVHLDLDAPGEVPNPENVGEDLSILLWFLFVVESGFTVSVMECAVS